MSDGALSLREVVETAEALGVTVGISDHVSTRNVAQFVSSREAFRGYLDALDSFDVFRSAEFCWLDPLWRTLPDDLLDRLDYRIGSNHGFLLPDGQFAGLWSRTLEQGWRARPQAWMEVMVDHLCELVRVMPIDIIAHSTLIPPALGRLESDVHAWWTEQREDRLTEAVVKHAVTVEISNRYRLPHDRLLGKLYRAGARFTLGSDGHTASQVARLEWAAETARRVGITEAEMFVPERR